MAGAALLVTRVGDELSAMRTRAGLSRKVLADLSGVSDGAIKLIEYGETEDPTPVTLRRIASGLATNRAIGRVDEQAAASLYAELMLAAGYGTGEAEDAGNGLEAALRAAGNHPADARMWAEFLRRYPRLTREEKRLIESLVHGSRPRVARLGERE